MAYDRPQIYLTWGGPFGSSNVEEWQCGVRLCPSTTDKGAALPSQAQLDGLLSSLSTLWTSNTTNSISCALQWVKAARLGLDGQYAADPVMSTRVALFGTGSTIIHPWQSALALTFRSNEKFGWANVGRVYWPNPAIQVSATTGKSTNVVLNLVNSYGDWFKTINTSAFGWSNGEIAGELKIRLMSKHGVTKEVASFSVGDVIDTQRRRRASVPETYIAATTYPTP